LKIELGRRGGKEIEM